MKTLENVKAADNWRKIISANRKAVETAVETAVRMADDIDDWTAIYITESGTMVVERYEKAKSAISGENCFCIGLLVPKANDDNRTLELEIKSVLAKLDDSIEFQLYRLENGADDDAGYSDVPLEYELDEDGLPIFDFGFGTSEEY